MAFCYSDRSRRQQSQDHSEPQGPWASGCKCYERPTRVGDVIPVGGIKLIFCLQDLFKELRVIFVIKRRVATEPARQEGVRFECA